MSSETAKTPNVLVLGAITPSVESARAERLQYNNLDKAVDTHASYEYARMADFWNAEKGSLEELEAAKQQALQYMLMGSLALQRAVTPEAQQVWSERYTQATSELYGTPDAELARKLWYDQQNDGEVDMPFLEAARQVGEYLDKTYTPVYEALGLDDQVDKIDAAGVADRFEAGLRVLADQYDAAWSEWTVERNEEKDSLSVVASEKKIIVGMHRADMELSKLKGLFSHEVLVHGLRAVNGSKKSEALGLGLADYLDAEEGLGVFVEYAINGEVSEKNIDRYVDIAYALGLIDGQEHTRSELIEHARSRAAKRNESSGAKKTAEDLEKEVYAHINRIYRGSLGDEHVGIFTKDISYHKGFVEMGRFVSEKIDEGNSLESIMDYLTQGKFDPTNSRHTAITGTLSK